MKRLLLSIFAAMSILLCAVPASSAFAGDAKIYTSWRNNKAVGGYDVVSFYGGNPVKGSDKYMTIWNGAQWQFYSKANLDLFLATPEQYAPAYGGYCAWALVKNKLAKGSPQHWTLKDGRLYLNFNKKIKDRWLKDIDNFVRKGDENWPKVLEN